MNQCPKCYRDMTPIEECGFCGHRAALSPVRSDDLFDVLVAIVNTAQKCPDRCMVDVCNDNFVVWGVNLEASYVPDDEDEPIKIERTSNRKGQTQRPAGENQ